MEAREAARYLGISEKMLARWVRQGLLPGAAPDGGRFDREVLERWAEERGLRPRTPAARPGDADRDPFLAAVEHGAVEIARGLTRASDAILVAARALPELEPEARERIGEKALDRERMATTGLGHGIATPHPRTPPGDLVRHAMISVLHLDPPIDWAAVDGAPVHTAFLLVSPNSGVHVRILARLARAVRSPGFVEFLATRPGREALLSRIATAGAEGGSAP